MEPEITIYPLDRDGIATYQLFSLFCKESIETTAQGMLEIAAYVAEHREQLEQEAQKG